MSVRICGISSFCFAFLSISPASSWTMCDDRNPVQCPIPYELPVQAEVKTEKAKIVRPKPTKIHAKTEQNSRNAKKQVAATQVTAAQVTAAQETAMQVTATLEAPEITPAPEAPVSAPGQALPAAILPVGLELSLATVSTSEIPEPRPTQSCLMQAAFNDVLASARSDPHFADNLLLRGLRSRKSAANGSADRAVQ